MFMYPELSQVMFRAGLLVAAVLGAVLLAHLSRADRQRVLNWGIAGGVLALAGLWLAQPLGWVPVVTANQMLWELIDFGLYLLLVAVCTRMLLGMLGPIVPSTSLAPAPDERGTE